MVRGREKLQIPSLLTMLLGGAIAGLAAIGLVFSFVPLLLKLIQALLALGETRRAAPPDPALIRGVLGWLVLSGGFVLFGGWRLRVGRSFALALLTAVSMMIPCCTSSCFVLGLPLGVWLLVVLFDRGVRDTFE